MRNNERLIERAKEKAASLWPGVPVRVIPSAVNSDGSGNEQLPSVQCMIYWESLSPVRSRDMTGSVLVTIHYQDQILPHLTPEIERIIKALNWEEVAADFQL